MRKHEDQSCIQRRNNEGKQYQRSIHHQCCLQGEGKDHKKTEMKYPQVQFNAEERKEYLQLIIHL